MLIELRIRNLAIVEDTVIAFGPGLNVLTGSTGAGKSIILTAVELLSGERARKTLVRKGAESLVIEGLLSVPDQWKGRELLGMDGDEDRLSIRREVASSGKSRMWINGALASLSVARETASSLFELHGQHRQQELLDPANHILYLDSWGDYDGLLEETVRGIEDYERLSELMAKLEDEAGRHREQEEFIRFQLKELEDLGLEPDLETELERKLAVIAHLQTFVSHLEGARALISEDEGSAIDRLSGAESMLASLAKRDDSWRQQVEELERMRITLTEMSRGIGNALGELEGEPEDVEPLQQRLAAIQRLKRKYRLDYARLVEKRDELRRVVQSLEGGSDELLETRRAVEKAREALIPLLEALSRERARSASSLDREVTAELARLGMKGALLKTRIEKRQNSALIAGSDRLDLSPRGWDTVEFTIRTNIGEDLHPLREVASGGELSRITLVLKKLQAEERGIPALIFDEIDTGLGADMGSVVAERMRALAKRYQIICVTHLPQVAAAAGNHIRIEKRTSGGRTSAQASVLGERDRVGEIARMLGGRGALQEKLAAELLVQGQSARSSVG